MSMVKRVLLLLKMEARELIRAASITASMRPLRPGGGTNVEGKPGKKGSKKGIGGARRHTHVLQ